MVSNKAAPRLWRSMCNTLRLVKNEFPLSGTRNRHPNLRDFLQSGTWGNQLRIRSAPRRFHLRDGWLSLFPVLAGNVCIRLPDKGCLISRADLHGSSPSAGVALGGVRQG